MTGAQGAQRRPGGPGVDAAVLVVVLLAVPVPGCLGGDGLSTTTDRTENSGCSATNAEGIVRTGQPVWADARADGAPAEARIDVSAELMAGVIDLILEHDGEEVWSTQLAGAGTNQRGTQVTDLEPGPYRLTARTDEGVADIRVELEISWGGGRCP